MKKIRDKFRTPYWMIRKTDMRVFRPISEDELVEKIESGEIAANDEMCPSGGYWFMLSEVNEVRSHLGNIHLASLHHSQSEEEKTSSTDTLTSNKTSIIPPKVDAVQAFHSAPQIAVPTERPKVAPAPKEPRTSERVFQDATDIRNSRKIKNGIGVGIGFLIFIFVLVWFWSGSY